MNDLLKTLIDVSPGIRFPDYEEEIFSDADLAYSYMVGLVELEYIPETRMEETATRVHDYAWGVIHGRWEVAEHMLVHSPHAAFHYSVCILQQPWHKLGTELSTCIEAAIATSVALSYRYAANHSFRFLMGEPNIMTSPEYAYYYACGVIKSRWPEAEAVIAAEPSGYYRKLYNHDFGTNI